VRHFPVTGGLRFIGVSLLKRLTNYLTVFIHNVDNLSLSVTHLKDLISIDSQARIATYFEDINNKDRISSILEDNNK